MRVSATRFSKEMKGSVSGSLDTFFFGGSPRGIPRKSLQKRKNINILHIANNVNVDSKAPENLTTSLCIWLIYDFANYVTIDSEPKEI